MKPIQTRYKGYRFRSRLEARWAVFFDAMGLRWEYEAEGYVDGKGRCYLPDFKLGADLYVEIKPELVETNELISMLTRECKKWGGFLAGNEANTLLVMFGPPRPNEEGVPGHRYYADHRVERIKLLECRRCAGLAWSTHGVLNAPGESEEGYRLVCAPACTSERYPIYGERIRAAVEASRGARFEHGEKGGG